ncbi:DnrP protein [Thalassomonas haliotis]|uniref:DnrP protein n=1 Tax=Thalassomonas haliotis TaxID=485448 RepID=A0ABY7VMF2_9GAMM|nr:DnrP protein [Thalassomonas haliotis]WDE14093.1 DnrP protein [Thalassomonas haliotis]
MNTENTVPCLYCQAKNDVEDKNCGHCGMPLALKHPENKSSRLRFFTKVFVFIAFFCLVMVAYLPR